MSTGYSSGAARIEAQADVLVIGGGPAATWAALTAREAGARVILVDKGYCGSSGVAAAATIGHWWVAPENRARAMAAKDADGGHLSDFRWMERVLEETWAHWPRLAERQGYDVELGLHGFAGVQPVMQGPVYLREMRRLLRKARVEIHDHAPALELLMEDGVVVGAAGIRRQTGEPWSIQAASVILATGGCAFKSSCLGSHTNAGDGLLMAAEAGARLSGMEFSNYYGLVPVGASVDKNGYFLAARYHDAAGREIAQGWSPPGGIMGTVLPQAFLDGPVFAQFTEVRPEQRLGFRANQPNLFIQFDRLGIDPFTQRFQIEPVMEGTIRGTGGVEIVDRTCWTGIEGLYVAGDTAARDRITGASSGAGSPNAAWTIASGRWSGIAAAGRALSQPPRRPGRAQPAGRVGLRRADASQATGQERARLLAGLQDEVIPLHRNGLRSGAGMRASVGRLDKLWDEATGRLDGADARTALAAREIAAMLAVARWSYLAALARTESRGMHVRADHPGSDTAQRDRILVAGIDDPALLRVPVSAALTASASSIS